MNERFLKTLLLKYTLNVLNILPRKAGIELLRNSIVPIKVDEKHQNDTRYYKEQLSRLLAARRYTGPLGHKNTILIGDILGLPKIATEILQLLVYNHYDASMEKLCECVGDHYGRSNLSRVISVITGISHGEVSAALSPEGAFARSGILLECRGNGYSALSGLSELPQQLYEMLDDAKLTKSKVIHSLLSASLCSKLTRTDFPQLGSQIDFAVRLLRGANKAKSNGVNILLYGAPGVGKTELAALLARESQCKIYAVGEKTPDERGVLSGADRLDQLKIKTRIVSRFCKSGIVLFDEMEDILNTGSYIFQHPITKSYLNRLLEKGEAPVIWTTNSVSRIDPAVLRRMSHIIEVKPQGPKMRTRIMSSYAAERNFHLAEADCMAIARDYAVAPAMLTSALEMAKIADGNVDDIRMSLSAINKAIYGKTTPTQPTADPFFASNLINTTTNLADLVANLKQGREKTFSLCLYGPPGTGKTAFAHHLAESLELQILVKRTSDLLSAYWGETEKNIARCFEEALDQGAVLLFDEVDSLLQSRNSAHYSWEITSVNEMLTQMESHSLPFICTTNFMDIVDEAALRRFTFKLKFDYLNPTQLNEACLQLCGLPMNQYIEQITLGDIVVVKKRLTLSGADKPLEPLALYKLLREESVMKCGGRNKIGF